MAIRRKTDHVYQVNTRVYSNMQCKTVGPFSWDVWFGRLVGTLGLDDWLGRLVWMFGWDVKIWNV